jgi:hypothetical protein
MLSSLIPGRANNAHATNVSLTCHILLELTRASYSLSSCRRFMQGTSFHYDMSRGVHTVVRPGGDRTSFRWQTSPPSAFHRQVPRMKSTADDSDRCPSSDLHASFTSNFSLPPSSDYAGSSNFWPLKTLMKGKRQLGSYLKVDSLMMQDGRHTW